MNFQIFFLQKNIHKIYILSNFSSIFPLRILPTPPAYSAKLNFSLKGLVLNDLYNALDKFLSESIIPIILTNVS